MMSEIRKRVPWWGRIGTKLILSRIPLAYAFWQRLGLFRHGFMDSAGYALGVFESHLAKAGIKPEELNHKTLLEIGPGDSIATVIIAHAFGANAILVDSGPYAQQKPEMYQPLCNLLASRGLVVPDLSKMNSVDDILEFCDGKYLTKGLDSWQEITSNSVDFIFSQAVLEHIRRFEFGAFNHECFRVMKPNGLVSHRVDLQDHLGGGLNNLRFSEKVWESNFFVSSGFYTNRIQMQAMLMSFEEAGFTIRDKHVRRWPKLPIKRKKLDRAFSELPDDALNISGFDVLLNKVELCVD